MQITFQPSLAFAMATRHPGGVAAPCFAAVFASLILLTNLPAEAAPKNFVYQRQPQSQSACGRFGFSMKREQEWFARTNNPEITSGASRPNLTEGAFVLVLDSDSDAAYVMRPEKRSHSENGFGGSISFEKIPRAGLYQIALSDDGLVDIIQNGQYLKKKRSTMQRACPRIRRGIQVELTDAPLVVQFGGVENPSIVVSITASQ